MQAEQPVMSKRYARQIAFHQTSWRAPSFSVTGVVCDRWLTNRKCTGHCKFSHEWTFTSQHHLTVAIKKAQRRIADAIYIADEIRSPRQVQLCVSCIDDTSDAAHIRLNDTPTLLGLPSAVISVAAPVSIPFVP
jgi:hypothetical protein